MFEINFILGINQNGEVEISESTHASLNGMFPRKVGFDTFASRLHDYKTKMIRSLSARQPKTFFGMTLKPSAARKSKRKDGDRLAVIYNQVHQFSLLNPAVQDNTLKTHLVSVGGQRRNHYDS